MTDLNLSTDLILSCVCWLIATMANALCDSIKQSRAADHQDQLWHIAKYIGEWIPRFLSGFFSRPFIIEWFNWEGFDMWHYTMSIAIFGTLIMICFPLHWFVRNLLRNYWNNRYEIKL